MSTCIRPCGAGWIEGLLEVVVLKSQFSDPNWDLPGWFSDSRANFHLWTVLITGYVARNVTQFHLFWASDCFFVVVVFHLFISHTNNYNTLLLQFITGNVIIYVKEKKRKRKTKSTKILYIVYILTIKRRLPALWSSITHLPICHLHFN